MSSEVTCLSQLASLLREKQNHGIYSLKPRALLELLESREPPSNREFQMVFPPVSIGSPSAFEATIICLLVRLLNPMKIVEIGTYTGYTTSLFAKNSDPTAKIITVDLPQGAYLSNLDTVSSDILLHNWQINDDFLKQMQSNNGEIYLQGLDYRQASKISLLKENSMNLSDKTLQSMANADFFFIDGGHSLLNIQVDTSTGLNCLAAKGMMLWHDYTSTIHQDVTKYIQETLSKEITIFHIQGTSLAIYFKELVDFFLGKE